MIQKCPKCGEWISAEATTTGKVSGAMGGAATGAAIGSIIPGVGTVIGGVIGSVIGSSAGETEQWEFTCPECGFSWFCDDESEDESDEFHAEQEQKLKDYVLSLCNYTTVLDDASAEEINEYIGKIQELLSDENINDGSHDSFKSMLCDALAFSQLIHQDDSESALSTINQSLAMFPEDQTSLAIKGMIYGIYDNPWVDYLVMKYLVNYKDIDYDKNFTHFTYDMFDDRFDELEKEYVDHFLEIPVINRKFLVVDDDLRVLPESFVVLPIDNLPNNICFPSGHPRVQELYVVHPYKPNEYIPYNDYQLSLFRDELHEFSWIMECLGAKSISFKETQLEEKITDKKGNTSIKGGASVGKGNYRGNISYENERATSEYEKLSRELMEEREYYITPNTLPYIPDDLVWYPHRPEWHRNCESRKLGRLAKASFQLSTSSISATNAQEKKKIEADLKILLFKANGEKEDDEQVSLRSEENHTWSVSVEFFPPSEYNANR